MNTYILIILSFINCRIIMSLANKHRPQTFDHIIGQAHITDILKAQIIGAKDSHSNYLFF